jgi:hypothetical protein
MHQMDAIRCKEWRILPGLSLLSDKIGYAVFMGAHIPLYSFLIWCLVAQTNKEGIIESLDLFLMLLMILHVLFLWHPKNEFKDYLSWSIIVGAALSGGIDILLN